MAMQLHTSKIGLPIAIKTAITESGKSRSHNANPKIRNNGYVIMSLSLLDILNFQSNQRGYQTLEAFSE